MTDQTQQKNSLVSRLLQWSMAKWHYVMGGVWSDPRQSWKVSFVKTLNLSVRSFLDTDLQTRAASLTYNTVLAIVPVLAMIFAIGRGFGFQNLLQGQLYHLFPSQHKLVETVLKFVDGYLAQASEGVFVGVGIVFLLWTMISLLGNVEDAFNKIWDVKHGRSMWRKMTDYLAIFLVLPILMICAGGLSILMTTTLHTLLPIDFLSPAIDALLDVATMVFTWLFFSAAYMLIPNAKVKFVNALIAGIVSGICFQVLQWVFLSGQLYVAKYNAIYGSFSFLPLFLLWLDLTWLITLIGCVICYASQNIVAMSFVGQIDGIAPSYRTKVCIGVMTIICKRFYASLPPLGVNNLAQQYRLPARLVKDVTSRLVDVGLLNRVVGIDTDHEDDETLQPAVPIDNLTVAEMLKRVNQYGERDFIPQFSDIYAPVVDLVTTISKAVDQTAGVRFIDIPLHLETCEGDSKRKHLKIVSSHKPTKTQK